MCPPGRNNPSALAAHNVNHNDLDASHESDGERALFAVAALHLLEDRPIENLRCVLKIDETLCKISPTLAFVPLKKH